MSTILTVILGIIGLGILVFIHELGHFLMARLVGVEVEAFALGWGKTIWSKTYGKTEYRIAALPIGGYCKMKGEITPTDSPDAEISDGSLYSVSAGKRILTFLGGPLFNLIFAILIFAIIGMIGYSYQTYPNTIVVIPSTESPAVLGGLQTGDTIVAIEGKETPYFQDLRTSIAARGLMETQLTVERDGTPITLMVTPDLDPQSGAGVLGVSPYITPIVYTTSDSSSLQPGDLITQVADTAITHTQELFSQLEERMEAGDVSSRISVEVLREGVTTEATIIPVQNEQGYWDLGFTIEPTIARSPDLSLFQAIGSGFTKTFETLALTVRGLRNLFRGVDATQALSGPIRITYMLGDVALSELQQGIGHGLRVIGEFMAFISIALAFGNLLPIPALDGGQICIGVYEAIMKRRISPQVLYGLQLFGFALLIGLLLFTLWNDLFTLLF